MLTKAMLTRLLEKETLTIRRQALLKQLLHLESEPSEQDEFNLELPAKASPGEFKEELVLKS